MKSVNRKDFISVGSVIKIHGTRGEVKFNLDKKIPLNEWAFLEFQGKPVPFFVERHSGTADQPIVKLRGIDSPEMAQLLEGQDVLTPAGRGRKTSSREDDLTGYRLIDIKHGEIGIVQGLEEMPGQWMIQAIKEGKEFLIPYVDAFIQEIDDDAQSITLDLPDGFLEIE
ncbi:MAG: ribosome maturation factor RimM [Bacteroidia bacterium]|jgi:16S rRNA processing protein RimM